eukprot:99500-Rhodomonas_salina.1
MQRLGGSTCWRQHCAASYPGRRERLARLASASVGALSVAAPELHAPSKRVPGPNREMIVVARVRFRSMLSAAPEMNSHDP